MKTREYTFECLVREEIPACMIDLNQSPLKQLLNKLFPTKPTKLEARHV